MACKKKSKIARLCGRPGGEGFTAETSWVSKIKDIFNLIPLSEPVFRHWAILVTLCCLHFKIKMKSKRLSLLNSVWIQPRLHTWTNACNGIRVCWETALPVSGVTMIVNTVKRMLTLRLYYNENLKRWGKKKKKKVFANHLTNTNVSLLNLSVMG